LEFEYFQNMTFNISVVCPEQFHAEHELHRLGSTNNYLK